ncbi:MAG: tetratricopeptide repeat protein [Treponema sp.]|jgi:outer membrane protein assembly factor BamD (BamD/ComL family)|nr:tetratricopeptide repeat protein [Treponema sp.]
MRIIISFFFLWQIISCASGPVEIPEGTTPDKLIQLGQEASDKNKYDLAIQYYQAVIDRFPTQIDSVCGAEYEIAFIHYKQKKYDVARQRLNALLARYDEPDAELLPGEYKILANIALDKMTVDKDH